MPNEQTKTKNVPAGAMRFTAGQFEFGSNGEDAKTAPIKMVSRSGKPIEHWWWGRVVHDLAVMQLHKSRLPIDYCHEANEVIGYLNHFDQEAGDDGAPKGRWGQSRMEVPCYSGISWAPWGVGGP